MSTSPSWFDQEKFSRLVKKIGPKSSSGVLPVVSGRTIPAQPPEKETRRLQRTLVGENRPDTVDKIPEAKIPPAEPVIKPEPSTPSEPIRATPSETDSSTESDSPFHFPPPMPLPEIRSESPLLRRTTPLPNLKSIFEYEKPADRPAASTVTEKPEPLAEASVPAEVPSTSETLPGLKDEPLPVKPTISSEQPEFPGVRGQTEPFSFSPGPKKEISQAGATAPYSAGEVEQLKKERADLTAKVEELSKSAADGNAARAEIELLRSQLRQADELLQATGTPGGQLEDLTLAITERDASRRDYAKLREDFENLKKEQGKSRATFLKDSGFGGAETPGTPDPAREEEITRLKSSVNGLENSVASLKRELEAMQKQITQAKDETSVAQRGLALSQRALQETRDALREASEALSVSKANAEKLKTECASLAQRNSSLQSRVDGQLRS